MKRFLQAAAANAKAPRHAPFRPKQAQLAIPHIRANLSANNHLPGFRGHPPHHHALSKHLRQYQTNAFMDATQPVSSAEALPSARRGTVKPPQQAPTTSEESVHAELYHRAADPAELSEETVKFFKTQSQTSIRGGDSPQESAEAFLRFLNDAGQEGRYPLNQTQAATPLETTPTRDEIRQQQEQQEKFRTRLANQIPAAEADAPSPKAGGKSTDFFAAQREDANKQTVDVERSPSGLTSMVREWFARAAEIGRSMLHPEHRPRK